MIEDFKNYLIAIGYTTKSAISIAKTAKKFSDWVQAANLQMETVSYNDVSAYMQVAQARNIKKVTQYKYLDAAKKYLNCLVKAGEITHNPIQEMKLKNVRKKTLHQALTPEELQNLYKQYNTIIPSQREGAQKKTKMPPQIINELARKRNKVIIGLLVYQGMRTNDISSLELKHVKLREGQIEVPSARRKDGRLLALESHQVFELSDYINDTRKAMQRVTGNRSKKVFFSAGGSIKMHNVFSLLVKELKTIQPKVTTLAQIRASVISHWLKHYNKRKVQQMAGHRYVSSTEPYELMNTEDLKAEVEKYYPEFL